MESAGWIFAGPSKLTSSVSLLPSQLDRLVLTNLARHPGSLYRCTRNLELVAAFSSPLANLSAGSKGSDTIVRLEPSSIGKGQRHIRKLLCRVAALFASAFRH